MIIPTYTAPTVTITNPSNAIADVGQTETFTMTITAGTSPFTENFYIVNSITKGTILAFNSIASSSSTTSNYIFVTNTLMVSNSPLIANAVVIDSNSVPTTANSPYSSSFTVNTAPTLTVTAGTNPIVTDNMETFTLKAAGGSGKLSCAFYNQTGTQSQIGSNSLIFTIGGSNTVSFAVNTVTPANTFTYNALCYDTVTSTAYTFNSPSNTVTVNLPSTANFIIALSEAPTGTQGIGSAVTYSANLLNLNTGTSPFTLNFVYAVNNLVANSITGITANGIQTYSYTITALGTFTMNAIITDSAGASANAVAVSITGIQNQGGGGGGGGGYAFTQPTTNATVPTNVTVGTVTVQLPLLGEFSAILVQYIGILFYYHVPISTYGIPISNPLPVSYILSWEAYVGALFLLFLYG
ncbi:MAG: hypothetical protein KGJ90_07415, partial [Patescibacteria group bacterium]|nr:hypothetical protein [Patescibacteria group bacterium]